MGLPDERREADELVEPLFAGLSGAQEPQEPDPEEVESDGGPTDPWKHPRPAHLPSETTPLHEVEPATLPLILKALMLLIVLVALSAFVYFAFGV